MRWNELINRVPDDRPIIGAEIGVWQGKMSKKLLTALPRLTLYMVDRWKPPEPTDSYYDSGSEIALMSMEAHERAHRKAAEAVKRFGSRARFLIGDSTEMANRVPDGSLDFAFIDGDHSREGVERDIRAWLPKVRQGGIIGGHDYDRPDKGDVTGAVQSMFGGFVKLGQDNTWWVRTFAEKKYPV